MIGAGLTVNVLLQYAAYDRLILPWQFAAQIRNDPFARDVSLLTGLIGCLTDRQFWYIFGWLLPLGAAALERDARCVGRRIARRRGRGAGDGCVDQCRRRCRAGDLQRHRPDPFAVRAAFLTSAKTRPARL
jgi:hypothetical protein